MVREMVTDQILDGFSDDLPFLQAKLPQSFMKKFTKMEGDGPDKMDGIMVMPVIFHHMTPDKLSKTLHGQFPNERLIQMTGHKFS